MISYFYNDGICQHTKKKYKSRVVHINDNWYSIQIKHDDDDRWIDGLWGTPQWLNLIPKDIEWARSNKR